MMEALLNLQGWLILADLIVMVSVILALYILVLNPRQRANRMASLLIAILAANALATSNMIRAESYQDASLPMLLMAIVMPAIGPTLILASLSMLKPAWLRGKRLWLLFVLFLLMLIPGILTLVDLVFDTSLYYVGVNPEAYQGGFISLEQIVSPMLGSIVRYIYLLGLNVLLIFLLIYIGLFDRSLEKQKRGLARGLLVVQLGTMASYGIPDFPLPESVINLIVPVVYILAYGFATFQQMISSRTLQTGKLQTRLTLLMVAIVVPALIFISSSLIRYSADQIEQDANETMKGNAEFLVTLVGTWLNDNALVLHNMASQPVIVSMDPARQKPALEAYAKTYQYMYLISTTNLAGMNVARNDENPLTDYSDRTWFRDAAKGVPLTLQTLIGRTTGQPALVASTPIYSPAGAIIGTAMFASHLTDLSDQVLKVKMGETGYAYLLDSQNQLVAHPDLEPGAEALVDFSEAAPVKALRQGIEPPLVYKDEEGIAWRAHYTLLENGWGVVVQQQETELFATYRQLQLLSWIFIGGGGVVIIVLVWASMRQAVHPINALTQTVKEIAAGNLERVAEVQSEDEVGTLAQAFNVMTNQVRTLVSGLERRVAERTLDLEHRSAQLQAAAEVGRAAARIRNLDELLPVVARLISERFGFYHVGIFLIDEQREYARLRAANSPGGQRMLARGHKLQVGQQGIVGYVTSRREPRVVLNVGEDTAYFNNPDLPDTQSEMALPLQVGGELLGALDVQSVQPNAFTEQDVETLQVLADQVAIAINSAQLLQQMGALLESERRGFGMITKRSWFEQMQAMDNVGFVRESSGLRPITSASDPEQRALLQSGQIVIDHDDPNILYVPVNVRGLVIGILRLVHDKNYGGWTEDEIEVMRSLAEQLGVALESARAYQQTQVGAQRDRILGEISSRVRETLDVQTILRTATQEVRQALDLSKVVIRLGAPPENGGNGKSSKSGGKHA